MTEAEQQNLVVWKGAAKPHYEVYYIKLNDLPTRTAAWLRYTLLIPAPGKGDPVAELWGVFFYADDPERNVALKESYPIDRASIGSDPFAFRIGEATLTHSSASGVLERGGVRLAWSLQWKPNTESFRYFGYRWMYGAPVPKTKVVSPNSDLRIDGEIRIEGAGRSDHIALSGAPGQQTHVWGTKHAECWVWGHCNAFEEDPEALFEGLTARVKVAGRSTPPLSVFRFRYKGEEHTFNRGRAILSASSTYALGNWRFDVSDRGRRFVGNITSRIEDLVGVEYTDPDGERLWCNNAKVASAEIEVHDRSRNGWQLAGRLTSSGTTAMEFVARHREPRVPIRI